MRRIFTLKSGILFALPTIVGAFLVFQIQPLLAKALLPRFGGNSSVWIASMLFFQVMLLLGYAYAYLNASWFKPRTQLIIHGLILASSLAFVPVAILGDMGSDTGVQPMLKIIELLAIAVGLPYFALSSTSPLLQIWFSYLKTEISPYKLYALSNAGSLFALLSYPFLFEPNLALKSQMVLWSVIFWLFTASIGVLMWFLFKTVNISTASIENISAEPLSETEDNTRISDRLLWLLLPFLSTALLLALTNRLTQDVAPVPLLWILPLCIYLLSFVLVFKDENWYSRRITANAFILLIPAMLALAVSNGVSYLIQIPVYLVSLFAGCMLCHGELYSLRPQARMLTSFYLFSSAGGALGGIFVGSIAPLAFGSYLEFQLSIAGILLFLFLWNKYGQELFSQFRELGWYKSAILATSYLILVTAEIMLLTAEPKPLFSARNFYGVLHVSEYAPEDPELHSLALIYGSTMHGEQFTGAGQRRIPTAYYWEKSPIGEILNYYADKNISVGVVGLGAGTLAAYAEKGDKMRFYEINPEVEKIAENYFSYLKDSAGEISVINGDARLSLDAEPPQNFDILVLDAFSSDSIPMHLLTTEAMEIYKKHITPDGIIAFHISNRYIDLEKPLANLADKYGMFAVYADFIGDDESKGAQRSQWLVMAQGNGIFAAKELIRLGAGTAQTDPEADVWTDDYGSFWKFMRGIQFHMDDKLFGIF